jgi:hypothetical protein
MDPDADLDPAIFVSAYSYEGTFTLFSKIKSHKEVTKQ